MALKNSMMKETKHSLVGKNSLYRASWPGRGLHAWSVLSETFNSKSGWIWNFWSLSKCNSRIMDLISSEKKFSSRSPRGSFLGFPGRSPSRLVEEPPLGSTNPCSKAMQLILHCLGQPPPPRQKSPIRQVHGTPRFKGPFSIQHLKIEQKYLKVRKNLSKKQTWRTLEAQN